jgi:hypothetical protein
VKNIRFQKIQKPAPGEPGAGFIECVVLSWQQLKIKVKPSESALKFARRTK